MKTSAKHFGLTVGP